MTIAECTVLLCGGSNPGTALRELSSLQQPKICPAVWGDGYFFYRCRQCETSPSSSLCVDCFKAGDHSGHEFLLEESHYGGCCDCGNEDAWKPTGFCPRHGRESTGDPVAILPRHLQVSAPAVLRAAMWCLADFVAREGPKRNEARAIQVVGWLRELCGVEVLLRVMRLVAVGAPLSSIDGAPGAEQPKPLAVFSAIVDALPWLREPLVESVLSFMLDLIQDNQTKLQFSVLLGGLYESVMNLPAIEEQQLLVIHKLAPQINNIPSLCRVLCFPTVAGKRGLANIIGENLVGVLGRILAHETSLDRNSKIVFAFSSDFSRVLDHAEVKQILGVDPSTVEIVRAHVGFISALQGFKAVPRKTGEHVEYESNYFYNTMSFEIEFQKPASIFAESVSTADLSGAMADCYLTSVGRWVSGTGIQAAAQTALIAGTPFQRIELGDVPLSVHIPVHRALARFVSGVMQRTSPRFDAEAFFARAARAMAPLPLSFLFEHAIQIQAWATQASAGLWILNGQGILAQAAIYASNFMDSLNFADLFLVQLACAAIGPDTVIATLLQRFGLANLVAPEIAEGKALGGASPQQKAAVMSGFLSVVINILKDRSLVPPCVAADRLLRKDLLHILATGDHSHSKLFGGFSRMPPSEAEAKAVLADIAEYVAPSDKAGVFRLKEERWDEFDPWYRLYDVRYLQQALERHSQALARKAKKGSSSRPLWSTGGKLPDSIEPFTGTFDRLLRSPMLHRALAAMARAARASEATSDMLVASCVHLGWLIAENCTGHCGPELKEFVVQLAEMVKSPPAAVSSNKLLADSAVSLLRELSAPFSELAGVVAALSPAPGSPAAGAGGAADKKELARRRQAALLESMKKQQAAFAAKQEGPAGAPAVTPDAGSTAADEEEGKQMCVLCRQEVSSDRLAAYVGRVTRSNIPWIAKRRAGFPEEYGSTSGGDGKWRVPRKAASTTQTDSWGEGLWADPNVDVGAEYQNAEEGASLQVSSCLHVVHYACFESYFLSVAGRFSGLQTEPIAPQRGDLLCPICRCVENIAIPVLPPQVPGDGRSAAFDPAWLGSVTAFANVPQGPVQVIGDIGIPIADMIVRMSCVSRAVDMSSLDKSAISIPVIGNALSSTLMSTEIALRETATAPDGFWARQEKVLRALVGSAQSVRGSAAAQGVAEAIFKWFVLTPLRGMAAAYPYSIVSPRADLFSALVRLSVFGGTPGSARRGDQVAWLAYAAAVTQALLHLSLCKHAMRDGLPMPALDRADPEDDALAQWFLMVQTITDRNLVHRDPHESRPCSSIISLIRGDAASGRPPATLAATVRAMTSAFTRRAALLRSVTSGTTSTAAPDLDAPGLLPTFSQLFGSEGVKQLVTEWCWQFVSMANKGKTSAALEVECLPLAPAKALHFIPLPETFQDLIVALIGKVCGRCGTRPKSSALCLACGALECVGTECCSSGSIGPLSEHAQRCGAGVVVGMLLEMTFCVMLRGHLRTVTRSLYLDDHGEEDPHLRRGRPLLLNQAILARFEHGWITGSLDQDSRVVDSSRVDLEFEF